MKATNLLFEVIEKQHKKAMFPRVARTRQSDQILVYLSTTISQPTMSATDSKDEKAENPTLGVLEEDDEFEEFAVAGEYCRMWLRHLT